MVTVLMTLAAQIAHAELNLSGPLSGYYPRMTDHAYPYDEWVEDYPYNGDIVLNNASVVVGDAVNVTATGRIVLEPGFSVTSGSAFKARIVSAGALVGALAIVTTNDIVAQSADLSAYVAFKRQSRPVYIVTEDTVFGDDGLQPGGWADGINLSEPPSMASSSKRADAIRGWLKDNYILLGINYVLLIGDSNPDGGEVPMKTFYWFKDREQYASADPNNWELFKWLCQSPGDPQRFEDCVVWKGPHHLDRTLVTDYYYSNVTFEYPIDGDGEETDFINMDLGDQDLHVGRLPVLKNATGADDMPTLDKVLRKLIAYSSQTNVSWRRGGLLAIDRHDDNRPGDMVPFGEHIRNRLFYDVGFSFYRVYEPYTPQGCHDDACVIRGERDLIGSSCVGTAWRSYYFGLVYWYAHGSDTAATDIIDVGNAGNDYTPLLDDGHPAFVVSSSCSNSRPFTNRNVGSALLQNGAIAFLGGTGVVWGGHTDMENPYSGAAASALDVNYGYMKTLLQDEFPAGAALSAVRTRLWYDVISQMPTPNPWTNFVAWDKKKAFIAQQLLFNLYGDPTIGINTSASAIY